MTASPSLSSSNPLDASSSSALGHACKTARKKSCLVTIWVGVSVPRRTDSWHVQKSIAMKCMNSFLVIQSSSPACTSRPLAMVNWWAASICGRPTTSSNMSSKCCTAVSQSTAASPSGSIDFHSLRSCLELATSSRSSSSSSVGGMLVSEPPPRWDVGVIDLASVASAAALADFSAMSPLLPPTHVSKWKYSCLPDPCSSTATLMMCHVPSSSVWPAGSSSILRLVSSPTCGAAISRSSTCPR